MAKNPYHDLFENRGKYPLGSPVNRLIATGGQVPEELFTKPGAMAQYAKRYGTTRQMMLPGTLTSGGGAVSPVFEEIDDVRRVARARAIPTPRPPVMDPRQLTFNFTPNAPLLGPAGTRMQAMPVPTTATASTGAPDSAARKGTKFGAFVDNTRKNVGPKQSSKAIGKAVDEAADKIKDDLTKRGAFMKGLGKVGGFAVKRILPLYLIGTIVSQMRSAPGAAREQMFNQDVSLANALSSMVDLQSLEMQSIGQEMELANIFGRIAQPSEASQYQQMIQSNIPLIQMASAMSNVNPAAGGMM